MDLYVFHGAEFLHKCFLNKMKQEVNSRYTEICRIRAPFLL